MSGGRAQVHKLLDILYERDREKYEKIAQAITETFRFRCSPCSSAFETHEEYEEHLVSSHEEMLLAFRLNISALVLSSQDLSLTIPGLEGAIQRMRIVTSERLELRDLYLSSSGIASSLIQTLVHPGSYTQTGGDNIEDLRLRIGNTHPLLFNDLEQAATKSKASEINICVLDSIITHLRYAVHGVEKIMAGREY